MLRDQKQVIIEEMKRDFARAQSVLFLDFTGLTVAEADALRRKLRDAAVTYRVAKNTLVTRAMEGTSYADAAGCLKGTPTGVVLGFEDPVVAARLTYEFLKECKHVQVKGGVFDQRSITSAEAEAISKMPGRREMQGMVLALALGPAGKLIGQIKGPAGKVVGAIDAKADAEEKQA